MIRRPPRSNRTGHTLSLHDALPIFREADGGALVFSWNPNGTVDGAIVGGTENADGANLNQEISRLLPGQTIVDTGLGLFSATTGLLDAGINYTLTISHNSFADRKSTRLNSSH